MIERTLAILKPDCVKRNLLGPVLARIEKAGFKVLGLKMVRLTETTAGGFYAVHRGKPFFSGLTDYMSSGPCIVLVLQKENAITTWRKLMVATNPANAEPGTIRKEFAQSVESNSVHGSDAPETAAYEIAYFFSALELSI
jgi:nucleoside-diphosphate kinase